MKPFGESIRRRVLVVDDLESIHESFRKILMPPATSSSFAAAKNALLGGSTSPDAAKSPRERFELDFAFQGEQGVQLAAKARETDAPFLVAFVDMRMPPGWDGATTVKKLWEVDPDIQVVVCTAFSDQPLASVAEDLGQADKLLIITKPFDPIEVVQAATALCEKRISHQAAMIKTEELERLVGQRTAEIEQAMLHDKLTGLPNRTMLMSRLENCIERHKRRPEDRFAVLFLDFDRFKLVNDSLGHECGDLLLSQIADRLRHSLRGPDLVSHNGMPSRLGGDEFIIVLEDLKGEQDAARVAKRLLEILAEPYELQGQKFVVTASVGIATCDRGYTVAGDMIRDADTAMYRAKAAGRARYIMFDETMHAEVTERLALETALRHAVQHDELNLHYQPIASLDDGALTGFESLVRWTLPGSSRVPPGKIIAVAEETGLIKPMTLNLLRRACRQLREWQTQYPTARSLSMSVNFSRRLVLDPDIVSEVRRVIEDAQLRPDSVVLEVTESALMTDKEAALRVFQGLRDLGIWLHLDDFGTGYSSLLCLYELPLCGVKIDRVFLVEAGLRAEQRAVLKAIVDLAKALSLKIIVEGLETTEQLKLVRDLGIQSGQGYLIGAPCVAEQAGAVFQDQPTLCYA